MDWQLQESQLELAAESLAAIQSHNSYFASEDIAAFIVETIVGRGHTDVHTGSGAGTTGEDAVLQ